MTKELAIKILTGATLGTTSQTNEAVRMAVEALTLPSAQPDVADINVGDTIYRQAVFDVLREECSTAVEDFLRDKVKAIPPAQPEQRWIPCSKNMPKEGQTIYASFPYLQDCAVVKYCTELRDAIDAWVPLPEPYIEDKDGN